MASRSSSVQALFLSSMSLSHLFALNCSGVIDPASPAPCPEATTGVSIAPIPAASPPWETTGVSSHRDRPLGVAPSAAADASEPDATGVSSHLFRLTGVIEDASSDSHTDADADADFDAAPHPGAWVVFSPWLSSGACPSACFVSSWSHLFLLRGGSAMA
eukprot:CAMPEP_0198238126 /NCGR_PEP_ID=MMETSP1446-20131203/3855_1 /TAXON_ID=1461542 ORGANISM="Unidentified sp, Strain CCMP2111" /NCGR_SAMPLE_ID=MMETSP1446 /ASSEMBLY_ACC=CAM_ASM_001112 /LENGTH=159 /DNA_ID=CAMNT_0043920475 /DNA_START=42 /DNA_END=518 /DNA_ORIENTATION=+